MQLLVNIDLSLDRGQVVWARKHGERETCDFLQLRGLLREELGIIQRCVVDKKAIGDPITPTTLTHGQTINISVRLISAPSFASWLPIDGETVSFYIGTVGENETGTFAGQAETNSSGIAELELQIDLIAHGMRTVQFYAVVEEWVTVLSIEKAALSWTYILGF